MYGLSVVARRCKSSRRASRRSTWCRYARFVTVASTSQTTRVCATRRLWTGRTSACRHNSTSSFSTTVTIRTAVRPRFSAFCWRHWVRDKSLAVHHHHHPVADPKILKSGGGAEDNLSALPRLSQMHTTIYRPFTRKKAAFWKNLSQ